MRHLISALVTTVFSLAALPALAGGQTDAILDRHVLPKMQTLAETTAALDTAARADCTLEGVALRSAFGTAFDAWIAVSHLRFGPAETQARGFALAFWPDTRAMTPKTLRGLIAAADPVVDSPARFATVSVAGRGFYALDYLLYDPEISALGTAAYRCTLLRAITADIATTAAELSRDWSEHYAGLMRTPGPDGPYQSDEEVLQEFFKALTTGLEVNADLRLGRPMGQIGKPRPLRAEARRSGRSLRHVVISLKSLEELSDLLAGQDADLAARMSHGFDTALARAEQLEDPVFAGVATPQGRLRVEVLQQAITAIRTAANEDMGPALGVAAGFNALDGD
ncbi:imelysin family protein [Antarcticimicrobium sediminis]|uniref:Peptidase M75 n=1 Tax=Antarcticimicrobium sediminis TaxID=2546227 RepID=A0A4R5F0P1_9RHOB|nr:imelysin family protein [Antarcticimicrobium sediminis]TDE40984.1 peptidase M75 [Antarcticimicrobium sediminis]